MACILTYNKPHKYAGGVWLEAVSRTQSGYLEGWQWLGKSERDDQGLQLEYQCGLQNKSSKTSHVPSLAPSQLSASILIDSTCEI